MRNKLFIAGVLLLLATYCSSCIVAGPGYYGYGGHWGGGYYHGGGGCHRGGYYHYR